MPRLLPVANGVLKHQLYHQAGTGDGTQSNPAVLSLWTYKASGSPVGATRIAAEQAAILAWVNANAKPTLPTTWQFVDLRTWDYGLDPAPKTRTRIFPPIQGTLSAASNQTSLPGGNSSSYIVALRTQPVGSVIRDRLNGRVAWPLLRQIFGSPDPSLATVAAAFTNLLTARLNGAGDVGTWSVVSFREGNLIRLVPLVVPVNHVLVQRVGTQRRRNPKPGPYARGA